MPYLICHKAVEQRNVEHEVAEIQHYQHACVDEHHRQEAVVGAYARVVAEDLHQVGHGEADAREKRRGDGDERGHHVVALEKVP